MGRQHTNSAAAASSTASLAQEGTSQRHAHPLHTQLLLWFIVQGWESITTPKLLHAASASIFMNIHTHMHAYSHTFCSFRVLWVCVVFAVMQRYHILCTQSCTSASLNGNRFNLHSKVLFTFYTSPPLSLDLVTPISSPKLVMSSLLASSILTSS